MVIRALSMLVALLGLVGSAFAQSQSVEPSLTLFENVRIFDGKSELVERQHERARPREHDREDLEGSDSRR